VAEASRRLLDFTQERLPETDRFGPDVQVLSLNSPGIQAEPEAAVAVRAALAVNDLLASVIGDHPDRFRGFAALPLQDRAEAADELERAVTQLGLVGGLVNGHTNGKYLDDPDFSVVWERAACLGVPLYPHPADGVDTAHVLSGHPELVGPIWSWASTPRPTPCGRDDPQSREGLEEALRPARPAHRAACSGVWHETATDGSFEAGSVVTGPGARISAGREQSSAETTGFLDARVRGVDLRWKS
jgi:hypothetical protein